MRPPLDRLTLRRMMIGVAVVSVGLLMTGVLRRMSAIAERDACRRNLRQIAMALEGYHGTQGVFPPGTLHSDRLPPDRRMSWVPLILDFTDHYQGIRFLFDQDRPWDSRENLLPRVLVTPAGEPSLIGVSNSPPWFPPHCPTNPVGVGPGMPDPLHYVGIAGLGKDTPTLPIGHPRAGVFGYDRQARTEDIRDGMAVTMMLAESTAGVGPWTAGGFGTVRGLDSARLPYLGAGRQFGGVHRGGAMVAMADGSVRFVGDSTDPGVFGALSTVAGGEALPAGWDR